MVDYQNSSQLHNWLFTSDEDLDICRARANYEARVYLRQLSEKLAAESNDTEGGIQQQQEISLQQQQTTSPISHFACETDERRKCINEQPDGGYQNGGPWEDVDGKQYLNHKEESVLVSFYASKLVSLIGPNATVSRLRRESKVLATAALLLRRFFLSNSVMLFDPKTIMVASAFLASKVEDVTADVRNLEEATVQMNAPVPQAQIVQAEVFLLSGIHFYLLCFHPYKAVLALTEDLRTFFKTSAGKRLLKGSGEQEQVSISTNVITGQDLKPIYDTARSLLDDVVVSDLPLLYTPGQVGLAALTAAQEIVLEQYTAQQQNSSTNTPPPPMIDFMGYVKERFPKDTDEHIVALQWLPERLSILARRIRELKSGEHGCCHYFTDLSALKKIHKKLKKVRVWANDNNMDAGGDEKSSKKKKHKNKNKKQQELDDDNKIEPDSKRIKTE